MMESVINNREEFGPTSIFFDRDEAYFKDWLERNGLDRSASDQEIIDYMVDNEVASIKAPYSNGHSA